MWSGEVQHEGEEEQSQLVWVCEEKKLLCENDGENRGERTAASLKHLRNFAVGSGKT